MEKVKECLTDLIGFPIGVLLVGSFVGFDSKTFLILETVGTVMILTGYWIGSARCRK